MARQSTAEVARYFDEMATAAATSRAAARRPAVPAASRFNGRLSFKRLGYRTQANYANEELGSSARSLRRLGRIGRKLAGLPATRAEFLNGSLPITKAEQLVRLATAADEERWLALARELTVRELTEAVRAVIDHTLDHAAGDPSRGDDEDDARTKLTVQVPGWMIGKSNNVLRLAAKVAGVSAPEGTRWEFIAAEFLSGAAPAPDEDESGNESIAGTPASAQPDPQASAQLHPRASAQPDPQASAQPDPQASAQPDPQAPAQLHPQASAADRGENATPWATAQPAGYSSCTPWELHDALKQAYRPAGAATLELGTALREIRNRRLWRILRRAIQSPPSKPRSSRRASGNPEKRTPGEHGEGYVSFDEYVRERLEISPRTARRLMRAEAGALRHRALEKACVEGRLTTLKASVVVRALDLRLQRSAADAWVEYARRMPLARLTEAVDWACARAATDRQWARRDGAPPHPSFRHRGRLSRYPRPMLAASTTSSLNIWLTAGERTALERAIKGVRAARGPDWPLWACLNDLLDHFIASYDTPDFRRLGADSPVLRRDDWQCQAPGCTARCDLHVHHILYRGRGGPDTYDNLIVLCDFHHLAIHRGWIRCWGLAPNRVRWSFGVAAPGGAPGTRTRVKPPETHDPSVAPIARFVGHYRLDPDEWWPRVEVGLFGKATKIPRRRVQRVAA